MLKQIDSGALSVAYFHSGPPDGRTVILLHGFPYDVHAYDEVTETLVQADCRVLVPYLRGFGPTRFLRPETPRSGQQAALASDLHAFMDALAIPNAVLAGYDWGGRAACIVSALWPERVQGLVSGGGYNIQDIPGAVEPQSPQNENRLWYQYYMHGERGRAGLTRNRADFCKLLWRMWSPTWRFDEQTYKRSAAAFDNPDFVDVVIHSYRHRFGLVQGDPDYEDIEQRLVGQPRITVPTISMDGGDNGVLAIEALADHARFFTGPYERRIISGVGHNVPQESPQDFADAVKALF
jgi:pimeloyl-ACP methyl ester carboxylesterase